MSDEAQVWNDIEILFATGARESFTLLEGRDTFKQAQDGSLIIETQPEPNLCELTRMNSASIAMVRTTKRTIPADTRTEGLKLVGTLD